MDDSECVKKDNAFLCTSCTKVGAGGEYCAHCGMARKLGAASRSVGQVMCFGGLRYKEWLVGQLAASAMARYLGSSSTDIGYASDKVVVMADAIIARMDSE